MHPPISTVASVKNSIVAILNRKNIIVGTGFLAGEKLILTCAHVVMNANAEPGMELKVRFTLDNSESSAFVKPEAYSLDYDVALLQVDAAPEGVSPLPLDSAAGSTGHTFYTYGFAIVKDIQGIGAQGEVIDTIDQGGLVQLRSQEPDYGMSGSPVFDENRRTVIGMVTKGKSEPGEKTNLRNTQTTFATSVDVILEVCKILQRTKTCPYRSLDSFDEDDALFFFGRDRLIEKLLQSLRHEPRFLALLGPSGCGKSSLLKAGLLPRLKQGVIHGSAQWEIIVTRPGKQPFDPLIDRGLVEATDHLVASIQNWLTDHPDKSRLLIVIDQFEELLYETEETQRQQFISQIATLLNSPFDPCVIISLRNDFYNSFSRLAPALLEWLERGLVNMPETIERGDLLDIIEEPAKKVGLTFEAGLPELILKDVLEANLFSKEGQTTILPLLEFCLTQLWENQEDGVLTVNAYNNTGGVAGSITRWADKTYYSLSEDERAIAQKLFIDLIHLGDDIQGIPDSRSRKYIDDLVRDTQELDSVRKVVYQLAGARLLVEGKDPKSGKETVEIIHDTLVREWALFRKWVAENRSFLVWRQKIREAAQAWQETSPQKISKRDEGRLYRGRDLNTAAEWLEKRKSDLNKLELVFIQTSIAVSEREKNERDRMLQRELKYAEDRAEAEKQRVIEVEDKNKKITYIRNIAIFVSIFAVFAALVAYGFSWKSNQSEKTSIHSAATAEAERNRADQQAKISQIGQLAAQSESTSDEYSQRSLLLAIESIDHSQQSLGTILPNVEQSLRDVLGKTSGIPIQAHQGSIASIAITPDGQRLISAGYDQTIGIWNLNSINSSSAPVILSGHKLAVRHLVVSPDGHWMVTASEDPDDPARLWNLDANPPVAVQLDRQADRSSIVALGLTPDNRSIFVGYLTGLKMYQKEKSFDQQVIPIAIDLKRDSTYEINISPNGKWLATYGHKGDEAVLEIWDLTQIKNPDYSPVVLGHGKSSFYASALHFSPDGRWFAAALQGKSVSVWDLSVKDPTEASITFQNLEDEVSCLTFDPTGRWLLAGLGSYPVIFKKPYSAYIWDLSKKDPSSNPFIFRGHEDSIITVAISPDSHWAVTGSLDHTLRAWNLWSAHPDSAPIILRGHEGSVNAAAFTPDGKWLVTAGSDGMIRLWNLNSQALPSSTSPKIYHLGSQAGWVFFNPASTLLYATSWDKNTIALNVFEPGKDPDRFDIRETSFNSVFMNSNHDWYAGIDKDGKIEVNDITSSSITSPILHLDASSIMEGLNQTIAAISPDLKWLISSKKGKDNEIFNLWKINANDHFTNPVISFRGKQWALTSAKFSPKGNWLMIISSGTPKDGTEIRAVNLAENNPSEPGMLLAGHKSYLTALAFSFDERWLITGDYDKTARIWDLLSGSPTNHSKTIQFQSEVTDVNVSASGKWLVMASGNVLYLSPFNGTAADKKPIELKGHNNNIFHTVFYPDETRFFSSDENGVVNEWFIDNNGGASGPVSFLGHNGLVEMDLSRDGRWLASGGYDGTIRIWDLKMDDLVQLACDVAGRNLTRFEWNQYFNDEPYHQTCSQWPEGE